MRHTRALRIALLTWLALGAGLASAEIAPPVDLQLVGPPRAGVRDEPLRLGVRILVGTDAELSGFRIEGEGWADALFYGPTRAFVEQGRHFVLDLRATPHDPFKPLVLAFELNGITVKKGWDLSPDAYERMMRGGRVRQIPGSEKLPFPGVDHSRADPGAPSGGEAEEACLDMFSELRGLRRELRAMRSEIASLREAVEGIDSAVASGDVRFPVDGLPMLGQANAPVTVVEFSDYQCPFCRRFHEQTWQRLRSEFVDGGVVRYIFHDFPLKAHPQSRVAARAARCAGKQGRYWEMRDQLFAAQERLSLAPWSELAREVGLKVATFERCLADPQLTEAIDGALAEAREVGVAKTPTFLVGSTLEDGSVKGSLLQGAQSYEALATAIRSQR